MTALLVVLKSIALSVLKKAGEALVNVVVNRLLSVELFESLAVKSIKFLLTRWKDSTENTLDDEIVGEVVKRLDGTGGGGDGN